MVAKIISGTSLRGALNYNENKVTQGRAELIWQNGYAKDFQLLNFHDKLFRLTDLSGRNERTKTNAVHISLNFALGEEISKEQLNEITATYMEKIGFGAQPYLIYLHKDAGHPHVHIVTTNIKNTGERISLHNLGRTKSEAASRLIEKEYGLVPACQQIKQKAERPILEKVVYGKNDTKRAITNVVSNVIDNYKFTSLAEFNAVLSQFNLVADRGAKDSRMYAKNGLVYWIVNGEGKKMGVPIKASSIYGKPTLKNLESRYQLNEARRLPIKQHFKDVIDRVLSAKTSQAGFRQALQAKGIQVIFRQNDEGRLYGVTFVDHQSKVVFNGSDLGKTYAAGALTQKFHQPIKPNSSSPTHISLGAEANEIKFNGLKSNDGLGDKSLLEGLLQPDYQETAIPGLLQNKRKRKRKRLTT